jgi:hypothetical protein
MNSRSSRARLFGASVVGVLATLSLMPTTAAASGPSASSAQQHLTVVYRAGEPLRDSTVRTVAGTPTADGGCVFRLPSLSLAAGQHAIESRQLSTDFTTCTTAVETGVPTTSSDASSGPALDARSGVTTDSPASGDTILATASAYYRVWWEDVINLRVTETRSNISWGYNGSCTTSVSGYGYWWWRSGTGWLRSSYGKNQSRTCSVAKVWSDATYKNGAFCWPGTVWNYYDNVEVRGWYNGTLGGSVYRTWTTYPFACPTLHWHQQLVRT